MRRILALLLLVALATLVGATGKTKRLGLPYTEQQGINDAYDRLDEHVCSDLSSCVLTASSVTAAVQNAGTADPTGVYLEYILSTPTTLQSQLVGAVATSFFASSPDAVAFKFTTAATTTRMSGITVSLQRQAGFAALDKVTAQLWSDDGGAPSKPSAVLAAQDLITAYADQLLTGPANFTDLEFRFTKVLTANTTYWIVFTQTVTSGLGLQFKTRAGTNLSATQDTVPAGAWTLTNNEIVYTMFGQTVNAIRGESDNNSGIVGRSNTGRGVEGISVADIGCGCSSTSYEGVQGSSIGFEGVQGISVDYYGGRFDSTNGGGLFAQTPANLAACTCQNIDAAGSAAGARGLYAVSLEGPGANIAQEGTLTATNAEPTLLVRRNLFTSAGKNTSGNVLDVQDNTDTSGGGTQGGNLINAALGPAGASTVFNVETNGQVDITYKGSGSIPNLLLPNNAAVQFKKAAGTVMNGMVLSGADAWGFGDGTLAATLRGTTVTLDGSVGVAVGSGGTPITKHLSAAFALNFGVPGSVPGCLDSAQQTLTGASLTTQDTVTVGAGITLPAGYLLHAFVDAADKVKVRWCQFSGAAADPDGAGTTYRVDVWKH